MCMLAYGSISIMWPLDRVFQSGFGNVDLILCRFDPPEKFLHIVPVQIFGLSEPSLSISYYSSVYFSPNRAHIILSASSGKQALRIFRTRSGIPSLEHILTAESQKVTPEQV